ASSTSTLTRPTTGTSYSADPISSGPHDGGTPGGLATGGTTPMTRRSSQSEARDCPVYSGSRRIPGLFQRERADGSLIYEARVRLAGKRQRLVLDATNKSAAIAELEALRVDRRRGVPARSGTLVPTLGEVFNDWLAAMALRVHHRDPRKRRSPRTVA